MILGQLRDLAQQASVLPAAIVKALQALQNIDLARQAVGRYEMEGAQLFYMIQEVKLRTLAESRSEMHQNYADIQMPLTAAERYGVALPQNDLAVLEDKLAERDVIYYASPAHESFIDLAPDHYAVFLPGELHRPCVQVNGPGELRKLVVKVHRELLGL